MSVAVEGTTVVSAIRYSHMLADGDVGIEDSIHPIAVCGIIYHDCELMPVCSTSNDYKC